MANSPQPISETQIWNFMMKQIAEIPERYRTARENQIYATAFMEYMPLGFDERTVQGLTAESMLAHDIFSINFCLSALQGRVRISTGKLQLMQANTTSPKAVEIVEEFADYDPAKDMWRVGLISGNIANLETQVVQNVIELHP